MKNKKILITVIAVVVLIIVGTTVYVLTQNKQSGEVIEEEIVQEIPKIDASEIGLTLEAGADGNRVIMTITETEDLTAVDYELSYLAEEDIPRGTIGHVDVEEPGEVIEQEMILGTCSDVCHYDEGVSKVDLLVKITKTDGKVYQIEESLDLTQEE